jgi:glutamyl-tRNA synthetase
MVKMIKEGNAYCDNTDQETMKAQKMDGIPSKNRDNTIEQNLEIFSKMKVGECKDYCVRGKINMQDKNKCLRDPVFYRHKDMEHHRVGRKYKIFPTYDFACPIVDSIEGVTHALRTNEYS